MGRVWSHGLKKANAASKATGHSAEVQMPTEAQKPTETTVGECGQQILCSRGFKGEQGL